MSWSHTLWCSLFLHSSWSTSSTISRRVVDISNQQLQQRRSAEVDQETISGVMRRTWFVSGSTGDASPRSKTLFRFKYTLIFVFFYHSFLMWMFIYLLLQWSWNVWRRMDCSDRSYWYWKYVTISRYCLHFCHESSFSCTINLNNVDWDFKLAAIFMFPFFGGRCWWDWEYRCSWKQPLIYGMKLILLL